MTCPLSPWSNDIVERHNLLLQDIFDKILEDTHCSTDLATACCINTKNALANVHGKCGEWHGSGKVIGQDGQQVLVRHGSTCVKVHPYWLQLLKKTSNAKQSYTKATNRAHKFTKQHKSGNTRKSTQ